MQRYLQEYKGVLLSSGIIISGNLIANRTKQKHIGNLIQGFGIGLAIGTLGHVLDDQYHSAIPHHDLLALIGLPVVFILDKTGIVKNEALIDNAYGISIGVLTQHLTTEGCSFCNTTYCKINGATLC